MFLFFVLLGISNLEMLTNDREMAVGNSFGATVLSSYGGFWLSIAITFIPGGFKIMPTYEEADGGTPGMFYDAFALLLLVSLLANLCTCIKIGRAHV